MVLACAAVAAACGVLSGPTPTPGPPEELRAEVIARRPHDSTSYTQGLVLADGRLFESSGQYGASSLREVDLQTGEVLRSVALDDEYFGEGLAAVDDRLVQLTWQEQTALVYSLQDFSQIGTFSYETEGWGLCDDGTRLVMSDGTSTLYFRDRSTFSEIGSVDVTNEGEPVDKLNELECVDGNVYANVYMTDDIVRVSPTDGRVTAVIDASGLLTEAEQADAEVLNGIAYDAGTGTFLLTGKYWPSLFVVRFVEARVG
jgi:glutaminyl-peptide cyclotransferase